MSFGEEVRFAVKILELAGNVNVLFSPVSILNGLSLIYFDSKNENKTEMNHIFGNDKTKEEINDYFSKIVKELEEKDGINIKFINDIFVSATFQLPPDFTKTINEKFNGEIHQINFGDKRDLRNDKTEANNISEVENGSDLSTNVILFTALNFAATWESSFDKSHMQIFYSSDSPREIKFMSKTITPSDKWNLVQNEKWTSIGIPYANYEAWMFIVLPNKSYSLSEMIKNLNIDSFKEWTKRNSIPETSATVTIPLFTVSSNLKLKEVLQKMGMNNVFTENYEFDDGTEASGKFDNLIHASYLTINERGTRTKKVTKLRRNSISLSDYQLTVDRPFLYFVTTVNDTITPSNLLYVGTFY